MSALRTALTAVCGFTMLAALYLSASLFVLAPPQVDYRAWVRTAGVIFVVGLITLGAIAIPASRGLRYASAAGAVVVATLGGLSVYRTISGPHVEGYALVLGSMLIVQAALSISYLACSARPGRPARRA
jgi:hypothetical protein